MVLHIDIKVEIQCPYLYILSIYIFKDNYRLR